VAKFAGTAHATRIHVLIARSGESPEATIVDLFNLVLAHFVGFPSDATSCQPGAVAEIPKLLASLF
jgi:hypothetical protein